MSFVSTLMMMIDFDSVPMSILFPVQFRCSIYFIFYVDVDVKKHPYSVT